MPAACRVAFSSLCGGTDRSACGRTLPYLEAESSLNIASLDQYGPPVSAGLGRDLLSNLASALRAFVLRPPRPGGWRPFPEQLFAIAVLDIALGFLAAVIEAGGEGQFHWAGLPRALFPVSLALLAGWLVARRSPQPRLALSIAVAILSLTVWMDLAVDLVYLARESDWIDRSEESVDVESLLFWGWAVAAVVAVLRLSSSPRGLLRLADTAWVAVALILPLWWVPYVPLWNPPDPDETADTYAASQEDVIYGQVRLLHNAAIRLSPQRPGVEDLYFVGAAGYAQEDVFLNEASLAAELVRSRFDAEGRTVLLSNNPKTVRTLPLASATSLAHTLKAVAHTMNREEDILFLFLTTHGSEDHTLAMEAWPLQLSGITPPMLGKMLDDAGFRWRVVVLSACYAGGFVETLKNDRTLIMTAADSKHPSFGCGADSRLTYFGKAFFDEALRETFSFPEAFEKARANIAAREVREKFEHSNPEIFVGAEIRGKLDRLARRMEARAPHRWREARCRPPAIEGAAGCGQPGVGAN